MLIARSSLLLKLQSRFAGGIRQRLDAPVINVTAAIEHNFIDTLGLGALGNGLADIFGSRQVSTLGARLFFALGAAGCLRSLPRHQ